MKKRMQKVMGALTLAVLMLVSTCIAYAAPAVSNTGTASSEVIVAEPVLNAATTTVTNALALDMSATVNAEDDTVIDVVISVKDIVRELDAVEFVLDFDETLVSPVITENGDAMNAFLTTTPMYTYVIPGASSMEVPVTRYEQVCSYDAENSKYVCRFMDLLEYDCAKEGEVYKGLIEDGDLVVTIPFKVLDGVVDGTAIGFTASGVKGTTRGDLISVSGIGTSATYTKAPATVLTLKYPSLSFESEILYNVYYVAEGLDDVVEMGLATFATEKTNGTVDNATDVIPGYETDGTLWKVSTNGISAKNLGDTLYFKVYAKLNDGSYVYSAMKSYSAVSYAKTILNRSSSSTNMKALVVAMLNYGTEAQLYFGHNTGSLMNAGLTAEQKALVKAYNESMVDPVVSVDSSKVGSVVYNGTSYSRRAPSVSFDGAFAINYYFTTANVPDGEVKLYYWTLEDYNAATTLKPSNASGKVIMTKTDVANQYWGQVSGIAAKELDKTVFVAGFYTYGGTTYSTGVLNYSIGKYCESIAAKSTSDQQAFAQATAVYGYYAKNYFANL